jgi:predicted transcriptional regulator
MAVREIPPPLELDCLRVLWEIGAGNASQVRQGLAPRRKLAYTTVLTLLERLTKRGLLTREKAGRSFRYTPTQDREAMRRTAVHDVVELFFDGQASNLVAWLEGAPAPTSEREVAPATLDATLL